MSKNFVRKQSIDDEVDVGQTDVEMPVNLFPIELLQFASKYEENQLKSEESIIYFDEKNS